MLPHVSHAILGIGDVVFDPTNYAKNLMTVLQTAKSNANELIQIENQVKQLANQALNLHKIPMSLLNELQGAIRDYNSILQRAEGISYQLQSASAQWNQMYGSAGNVIDGLAAQWNGQVKASAANVAQMSALTDQLQATQARVGTALSLSDAASGNLDVTQATNQLIAIQIQQQAALLDLQAASARAEASFYAKMAADQDAARQRMQEWLRHDPNVLGTFRPAGQTSGGLPMPDLH